MASTAAITTALRRDVHAFVALTTPTLLTAVERDDLVTRAMAHVEQRRWWIALSDVRVLAARTLDSEYATHCNDLGHAFLQFLVSLRQVARTVAHDRACAPPSPSSAANRAGMGLGKRGTR